MSAQSTLFDDPESKELADSGRTAEIIKLRNHARILTLLTLLSVNSSAISSILRHSGPLTSTHAVQPG